MLKYLTFLCHQHWNSEDCITRITQPILFLSGLRDELVPSTHMRSLFNSISEKRNGSGEMDMRGECGLYWKEFSQGRHNDTTECIGYMDAIQQFMLSINRNT